MSSVQLVSNLPKVRRNHLGRPRDATHVRRLKNHLDVLAIPVRGGATEGFLHVPRVGQEIAAGKRAVESGSGDRDDSPLRRNIEYPADNRELFGTVGPGDRRNQLSRGLTVEHFVTVTNRILFEIIAKTTGQTKRPLIVELAQKNSRPAP